MLCSVRLLCVKMYDLVKSYVPSQWSGVSESNYYNNKVLLTNSCEEYAQIAFEVREALEDPNADFSRIYRIQDVHGYGQVLLREQLVALNNREEQYYRVRRYIAVRKCDSPNALKYNLDTRRCPSLHSPLTFMRNLRKSYNEDIFVVKVITNDPNRSSVRPSNSLEYYIEYIVE